MQLHNQIALVSIRSASLAAAVLVMGSELRGESAHRGVTWIKVTGSVVATGAPQGAASKSGYASVHGLKMYYEIHGAGQPLVLLHGALSTGETDFGKILPSLAKTRQVIVVEQQAHGHTADIDRPLSYEQMAGDTLELLQQLKIGKADFLGYSMGGSIALQIAMRHPDLVGKLVFAGGASYSPDGLYQEILKGEEKLKPGDLDGSPWQKAYAPRCA